MKQLGKILLITGGCVFTTLGVAGVFLPLLPSTPFLLLAAACFAKSSERLYEWLINNKWFGSYIRNYHQGRGIPLKAKVTCIVLLWLSIGYSIVFMTSKILVRSILFIIAAGVTIHVISVKTYKKVNEEGQDDGSV